KELDKFIELENKVKVLDNIVYKTGQSIQTMNMLNNKCRMSFAKPEFLKKAQRENPRLYDIDCYNDKLALMLAPDTDEEIRLEKERVILTTSVSRPTLKINLMGDRVMCNSSQGKKQEVEDQRRNVKLSKNKTSVTACNDSLNGYKWQPKSGKENVNPNVSMPLGNASRTANVMDTMTFRRSTLLINFVEKFLRTVKFGNDQIAPILGYGDLVQGAVTIKRVYYVEGLNHNLFSVGQSCDADLEVSFRKSTCFIRDLKGNDLLTGSRGTDLYSITLQDTNSPNPICLMAKETSSQAWLWHHRLSHLNFDIINLLSKNDIVVGLPKLKFVKDHLRSSCELESQAKVFSHYAYPKLKKMVTTSTHGFMWSYAGIKY
nr:retrovirus-related Pol polyprotein from transposon TNT 1-94 [Tanacetum cinerariifolium]